MRGQSNSLPMVLQLVAKTPLLVMTVVCHASCAKDKEADSSDDEADASQKAYRD
jgi:hypothetical protein